MNTATVTCEKCARRVSANLADWNGFCTKCRTQPRVCKICQNRYEIPPDNPHPYCIRCTELTKNIED